MASLAHEVVRGFRFVDEAIKALSPAFTGAIILGVASLAYLALDREPPFSIVSVYPAAARPGDRVMIVAQVKRNTARGCDATMSRTVIDGAGTRFYESTRHFGAEKIAAMARESPNMLRVSIFVPAEAKPGRGLVVSDLDYICNITHRLAPINVMTTLPFTVLPGGE